MKNTKDYIIPDGAHRSGLVKDYGGRYNPDYPVPVVVSGVWLRREGNHVVVLIERDGRWTEVIKELVDGAAFSHIVEAAGIRSACDATFRTAQQCWTIRDT